MPTYEYECKSCGHNFEVFQSMSDAPLKECPQCGKEVRRLIYGGSGVIFKGSGFYVTDKKKAGGSGPAKAPPAAKGDGDSKAPKNAPEAAGKEAGGGEGAKSGGTKPESAPPSPSAPASKTPAQ